MQRHEASSGPPKSSKALGKQEGGAKGCIVLSAHANSRHESTRSSLETNLCNAMGTRRYHSEAVVQPVATRARLASFEWRLQLNSTLVASELLLRANAPHRATCIPHALTRHETVRSWIWRKPVLLLVSSAPPPQPPSLVWSKVRGRGPTLLHAYYVIAGRYWNVTWPTRLPADYDMNVNWPAMRDQTSSFPLRLPSEYATYPI